MTPRVGILSLARPTFDIAHATRIAVAAAEAIASVADVAVGGPNLVTDGDTATTAIEELAAADIDLVVVVQATFTDAETIGRLARFTRTPLLVWGVPEERTGGRLRLNSLCGINLAAYALGRIDRGLRHLYASPDEAGIGGVLAATMEEAVTGRRAPPTPAQPPPEPTAAALAKADRAILALDGLVAGVVGDHPTGFDPCAYDRDAALRLTGVTIDRGELDDVFERAAEAGPSTVGAVRTRAETALGSLDDLDDRALERSLRLYAGMRSLADERRWSGVAMRCWPECFTEFGGAACSPLAMLTSDGTPGMCEADVYGLLTALTLQRLDSDHTTFVADLVHLDTADDTGVLWHCGLAPVDMAGTTPSAGIHSNRRLPLLHDFALAPGRVTIARISQSRGEHRLVIGAGEMLPGPPPFSGTSGVVRFDRPAAAVLDTIMTEGLEHHYAIVYGEYREALHALAHRWQIPTVALT